MYCDTGKSGGRRVGIAEGVFWAQYADSTDAAEVWSSLAVEPQLSLTESDMAEEMAASWLLPVQTHSWSSVATCGQLELVCDII